MGKVFKSAKKIVKKAAPVIGGAVGFAVAGPAGAAIGSGIGGLAGGHGVGKSLMYAGGAYMMTGGAIPGLGSFSSPSWVGQGIGGLKLSPASQI